MAKKRQQKDAKKEEKKRDEERVAVEDRLDNIEQFLGSIFGNDFEIQNIQYLLGIARNGQMRLQMLMNENAVFRQFLKDAGLEDKFVKWQEVKAKEQEEMLKAQMEAAQAAQMKPKEAEPNTIEELRKKRLEELEKTNVENKQKKAQPVDEGSEASQEVVETEKPSEEPSEPAKE